jgi:hypothetical protein
VPTLYLKLSVAGGVDDDVYVKPPPVLASRKAQEIDSTRVRCR